MFCSEKFRREKKTDQTRKMHIGCLRGLHNGVPIEGSPGTPRYHTTVMFESFGITLPWCSRWFQGAINQTPMMPRDADSSTLLNFSVSNFSLPNIYVKNDLFKLFIIFSVNFTRCISTRIPRYHLLGLKWLGGNESCLGYLTIISVWTILCFVSNFEGD